MERRRLGDSSLEITPIGFGAWAIGGGDWVFGWGPQDDALSVAAIERAVDLGINWIDTAAVYGLGHSEKIVARALASMPAARRPYVFTKCSLVWDETGRVSHSLKAVSVRREIEESLRRLKLEAIDLYQIHWPSFPPGSPAPDVEEAWSVLADARREGLLRFIGVSNFGVAELERIAAIAPVTSLQPPYSMLMRGIERDLLPWCERHGVGVLAYSPMQSGLLSGTMTRERVAALPGNDWRRNSSEFKEPRLSRNLALVEKLREIGARHGRGPGEVAIAWTLREPVVTAAIVGARGPAQVEGVVGAASFRLSPGELAEIQAALPEAAPGRH